MKSPVILKLKNKKKRKKDQLFIPLGAGGRGLVTGLRVVDIDIILFLSVLGR